MQPLVLPDNIVKLIDDMIVTFLWKKKSNKTGKRKLKDFFYLLLVIKYYRSRFTFKWLFIIVDSSMAL